MPALEPHIFFGLDLGRRQDPFRHRHSGAASGSAGHLNRATFEPERPLCFVLRHVEAFPLGTPYFDIARRVRDLIGSSGPYSAASSTLVVDASGVGAPIVEAFRATRLGANLIPITITAAATLTRTRMAVTWFRAAL